MLFLTKKNPSILKNVAKRFPIIIIDECQDLSNNQLVILNLLTAKGVIISFIGDNNQSIYEFKKVYVENINTFISNNKMSGKLLTKNFRSNQKIVNVSMALEKYNTEIESKQITAAQIEIVDKSCLLWEYTEDELPNLPQKFIDHVNSQNSTCHKKICISKSAILARAHSTLSLFRNQPTSNLNKIQLFANALNCWNNTPKTGKDLQNSLQLLGKIYLYACLQRKRESPTSILP